METEETDSQVAFQDVRSENTVCNVWNSEHTHKEIYYFYLDAVHMSVVFASCRLFTSCLLLCRNLENFMNFTCSECWISPLHAINLIIYFSQIKCALCSHLRTSCKSLWLVYTPVYSSCRVLSPRLAWGRGAITPFKELFSWKLPRVYADYFPQST